MKTGRSWLPKRHSFAVDASSHKHALLSGVSLMAGSLGSQGPGLKKACRETSLTCAGQTFGHSKDHGQWNRKPMLRSKSHMARHALGQVLWTSSVGCNTVGNAPHKQGAKASSLSAPPGARVHFLVEKRGCVRVNALSQTRGQRTTEATTKESWPAS